MKRLVQVPKKRKSDETEPSTSDPQDNMDLLKKFITQKKVDAKFKKAGTGHTLAESAAASRAPASSASAASSSSSSRAPAARASGGKGEAARAAAAQAALARHAPQPSAEERAKSRSQATIRAQAARLLQAEAEAAAVGAETEAAPVPGPREVEVPAQMSDAALLFTCDLLGEAPPRPREEVVEAVGSFLRDSLEQDAVVASCLMIHSLNKAQVIHYPHPSPIPPNSSVSPGEREWDRNPLQVHRQHPRRPG